MRKCRVAHLIYSKKIGGSEMVAANVCANLDRARFEPLIIFLEKSSGPMPQVLEELSVPHVGFNLTRLDRFFRPLIVASVLNKLKIDILHVHHVSFYRQVALGVKLSRVKNVLVTEHSKHIFLNSPIMQKALLTAIKNADFFTVVAEDIKEYFVKELGLPEQRIAVIRNGVDVDRFTPKVKSRLNDIVSIDREKKILLCVGRLTSAKDHSTLLLAMKKLIRFRSDVHLVVIGEGELREFIEAEVENLGLHTCVHLLGNRTDVYDLMPSADLFVLSSRHEGLPMVLLEAMACGLPVVATKVGGIPEVVIDGVNGLLVSSEDPDALARKLEYILSKPGMLQQMGLAGREMVVNKHSVANTTRAYAGLYEQVMTSSGGEGSNS